jgi:hypothetical protein
MANNKKQAQKKKPQQQRSAPKVATRTVVRHAEKHSHDEKAYARLLMNPCTGEMVKPCYQGAGMAYRIRLQSYITPEMLAGGSSPNASGHVKRSCVVAFVPSQNKIIMGSADGDQATLTMGKTKNVFDNFIFTPPDATGGKVADSFRTVAACLKFIPEGDYGTRSGVIGTAYLAGANWGTIGSNTATATNILNAMTKVQDIGQSSCHSETRWFPTSVDQDVSDPSYVPAPEQITLSAAADQQGTIMMVLDNVDCIQASGQTMPVVQGKYLFTAVYEWSPNTGQSATAVVPIPPEGTLSGTQNFLGRMFASLSDAAVHSFEDGVRKGGQRLLTAGANTLLRAPTKYLAL